MNELLQSAPARQARSPASFQITTRPSPAAHMPPRPGRDSRLHAMQLATAASVACVTARSPGLKVEERALPTKMSVSQGKLSVRSSRCCLRRVDGRCGTRRPDCPLLRPGAVAVAVLQTVGSATWSCPNTPRSGNFDAYSTRVSRRAARGGFATALRRDHWGVATTKLLSGRQTSLR